MQLGCWERLTDNVFLLLEIDVMMWLPFFGCMSLEVWYVKDMVCVFCGNVAFVLQEMMLVRWNSCA